MKHLTTLLLTLLVLGGCSPPKPTFDPAKTPSQLIDIEVYDLALYCSAKGEDSKSLGYTPRGGFGSTSPHVTTTNKNDMALFISKEKRKIKSFTLPFNGYEINPLSNLLISEDAYSWTEYSDSSMHPRLYDGKWKEYLFKDEWDKKFNLTRDTLILNERHTAVIEAFLSNPRQVYYWSLYSQCSIVEINELLTLVDSWHVDHVNKEEADYQEKINKKNEERERLKKERKI